MDDGGYGADVSEALTVLLRRDMRSRVYGALTRGVGEGIDEVTYPVISGLARRGSCTSAELAQDVSVDRSVVSRRATTLEHYGFLARTTDPRDSRGTLLVLTPRGQEAVTVMRERLASLIGDYLAEWSEEEVAVFVKIFRRFVESNLFTDPHSA
ncbi:MarR family transcriptional regulator [Streptomyces sp. XM4193]|uniref:MarR family winged helix-turn-helix transcriptional regulator n=1 Tax=Streptomyces sp. XM4193 TaxID=2929782 RepID=UPI001FF9E86B|nr:MarR family transcriptional regulator [Streptomyces sp. XM4193]MCK1796593.1 MarR family transcriptional regulator [Streptomyces sp. XM4193]